jgi:hypothetical protein
LCEGPGASPLSAGCPWRMFRLSSKCTESHSADSFLDLYTRNVLYQLTNSDHLSEQDFVRIYRKSWEGKGPEVGFLTRPVIQFPAYTVKLANLLEREKWNPFQPCLGNRLLAGPFKRSQQKAPVDSRRLSNIGHRRSCFASGVTPAIDIWFFGHCLTFGICAGYTLSTQDAVSPTHRRLRKKDMGSMLGKPPAYFMGTMGGSREIFRKVTRCQKKPVWSKDASPNLVTHRWGIGG